jgi:excisionase family DNA binding protein
MTSEETDNWMSGTSRSKSRRGRCIFFNQWSLRQSVSRRMHLNKQQPSNLPHLVGAAIIAESTGYSVKTVYKKAARGRLPHYRFEGSVRFDPIEIKEWIDTHKAA